MGKVRIAATLFSFALALNSARAEMLRPTTTPQPTPTATPVRPSATPRPTVTPSPSPSPSATPRPTVTPSPTSKPDKVCCSCTYQESANGPCGNHKDPSTCYNSQFAEKPHMQICTWVHDFEKGVGTCINTFEKGCKQRLAEDKTCDVPVLNSTTWSEYQVTYQFPASLGCTEVRSDYFGHGKQEQCGATFEAIQRSIDSTQGSCQNFNFKLDACLLFANSNAAVDYAKNLCLASGKTCTVRGFQCNGVADFANGCLDGEYDSTLTLTVCGKDPKPTVTPEFVACDAIGPCDEYRTGQSLTCKTSGGANTEKKCCQVLKEFPPTIPGNPPYYRPVPEWMEGALPCPEVMATPTPTPSPPPTPTTSPRPTATPL